MAEGIEVRHRPDCRSRDGGRCSCSPSYRAQVWLPREGKRTRRSFRSLEEARAWRAEAASLARKGALRAPTPKKLRVAADQWLEQARAGITTNRSGDPYKPSALRGYDQALRLRVLPTLGDGRFVDVRLPDIQRMVEKQKAEGLAASTIEVGVTALRAIYRDAIRMGELAVNPTRGVKMPRVVSKPKRIASPQEAAELIAAVSRADRPIWATAFYAGLRRGELLALRFEDVDLAEGVIRVERGWDQVEGEIPPKTDQGRRRVPIPGVLRDYLDTIEPGEPTDMIFGAGRSPFKPEGLAARADRCWEAKGLQRITPHEARHTFASLMIAAGVNAKALSVFMGHYSINVTMDLYGHLMPGSEGEAAALLDAFLDSSRAREEQRARAPIAA